MFFNDDLSWVTDGGSVTWYEPPPVVTTSITGTDLFADSKQLIEGNTDAPLSWNFSLTADLTLFSVVLTSNNKNVATIAPSLGIAGVVLSFKDRFNITWIPNRATLIIFNVTADDKGEFGCTVSTFQGITNKVWVRKIPVQVVGKLGLHKMAV